FGKLLNVLLQQVGEPPEQLAAVAGRHFLPCPAAVVKSLAGSFDGAVHLRRTGFGHLGDHLSRRWIDGIEALRARNPLAADQELAGFYFRLTRYEHIFSPQKTFLTSEHTEITEKNSKSG